MATRLSEPPPLLEVSVPHHAPTINADEDLLASFVYPQTPQWFLTRHYCSSAVAWRGGGTARLRHILNDFLHAGSTSALVRETASEAVHCWLKREASAAPLARGASTERLDSLKLEDGAQALTAHAAGASLYMRAPQEMHDAFVPALTDCLGMAWGGYYDPERAQPTGEIEVFVSRPGHTTDWHTDFQQNFTVQLRGRKRWSFRRSRVPAAPRAITPHFVVGADVVEQQVKLQRLRDPDFAFGGPPSGAAAAAEVSVVLEPGDLLYFPAGMWHSVEALAGGASGGPDSSLSINLSMAGGTWADSAAAAVRHLLWRDDVWRRPVCVSPLGMGLDASQHPARSEKLQAAPSSAPAAGGKRRRADAESVPAEPFVAAVQSLVHAPPRSQGRAHRSRAAPHLEAPPSLGPGHVTAPLLAGLPLHALTGCHLDPEPTQPRRAGAATANATGALALLSAGRGVYASVAALLERLRRAVAQLRPEHLLPPLALLSPRFSDLSEFNEAWAIPRGLLLHLDRSGRTVVTVLPEESWGALFGGGGASSGASRRTLPAAHPSSGASDEDGPPLGVNPLAVCFPAAALGAASAGRPESTAGGSEDSDEDTGDSDADPPPPPAGWTAWVVHVNCGFPPDMASQVRAVLHVPDAATARAACGLPLRLDNAMAAVARLCVSDGRAGATANVRRPWLRSVMQGGGASRGGTGATAGTSKVEAAERALLASLVLVGVLSEEDGNGS